MATQSHPPPTATHQNQDSEVLQPTNVDSQNVKDPAKPSSTTSVFMNSEPLQEEQVQNAVKFLSHPKVRGSPVIYRRSFLEKKGLTKEEIDEAFRRVPDSAPTVQTDGVNQDGQLKSSSNIQQQAHQQTLQPALPASTGVNTSTVTLSRSRFHWSHALIAVGLLATSGAGTAIIIKNSILPRFKSWIRKVVLDNDGEQLKKTDNKPTLMEEAVQAAKSAADVAKASQEILASEGEERRYFVEVVSLLDKQVQEMKSMTNAIRRLEGQEDLRISHTSSKQLIVNGKVDYDLRSGCHIVRSSAAPASVEPLSCLHPKSYMEPWEVGQVQSTSAQMLQSQVNGENLNTKAQDTHLLNGDDLLPWWQRKNVRIRENDNENESNGVPYAAAASSQQPFQRVWVPPQPPPVAMAEAAETIIHPKPVVQKEQMSDNQSVAPSSDGSDDMHRVPKQLHSEGAVEGSSVNSVPSSGQIQA